MLRDIVFTISVLAIPAHANLPPSNDPMNYRARSPLSKENMRAEEHVCYANGNIYKDFSGNGLVDFVSSDDRCIVVYDEIPLESHIFCDTISRNEAKKFQKEYDKCTS